MLASTCFIKDKNHLGGLSDMCFECLKTTTDRKKNPAKQKKKKRNYPKESRTKLAQDAYVFEDNKGFPRADMFRLGHSLREVFEENAKMKVPTKRKFS